MLPLGERLEILKHDPRGRPSVFKYSILQLEDLLSAARRTLLSLEALGREPAYRKTDRATKLSLRVDSAAAAIHANQANVVGSRMVSSPTNPTATVISFPKPQSVKPEGAPRCFHGGLVALGIS